MSLSDLRIAAAIAERRRAEDYLIQVLDDTDQDDTRDWLLEHAVKAYRDAVAEQESALR